jgi:4-amino-4-deoxy-L-arabinose transferase-like glycosyltransferase
MREAEESRTPWLSVVAVCLAVAGVYWFIDSCSTLWDRDEPRFSRATAEMVESGNYLYPTFNGELRPDKPILIYWLMSVPMRVLGQTSLACRFFSSVGIAITCVLTFLLGRRFLGVQAGLWSMAILPSTLLVVIEGTAATSDGVLLAAMVAVMMLFGCCLASGLRWRDAAAMGLALGLALLAKGPVALLPLVVIAVTLWRIRKSEISIGPPLVRLGGAVVMGALLFVAWAIPANNATHGEFLRLGLGYHVLARTARPLDEHGGHFLLYLPYYLPVMAVGFFPWTLHLPGAISAVLNGRVGTTWFRELFLAWVVSVVVIMTFVATKLPNYILFAWPAMALAVGGTLAAAPPPAQGAAARRGSTSRQGKLADTDRRWLRGGVWFFGPMAGGVVAGFLVTPVWLHLPGAILPFWAAAGVLLAVSVLAIRQQLQDDPQASAITLLVGMVVLLLPVMLGVMPVLEEAKISPALAQAVKEQTAEEVPVAAFDYDEPTLNFYVDRRIEPLYEEEAVAEWALQRQPGVLIITTAALAEVERRCGPLGLTEMASKEGLSYSLGNVLEVAALLRRAADPTGSGAAGPGGGANP